MSADLVVRQQSANFVGSDFGNIGVGEFILLDKIFSRVKVDFTNSPYKANSLIRTLNKIRWLHFPVKFYLVHHKGE